MKTNKHITKVREWMRGNDVDAVIVTNPANQFYLSGFKALIYSRPILLIIEGKDTAFIIPGLEEKHARADAEVDKLYVYHEYPEGVKGAEDPTELLKNHLAAKHSKGSKIAFDLAYASAALTESIRATGFELVDATEQISKMRYIKDQYEIELMEEAGRLVGLAVEATLRAAAPGVTELEVDAKGNAVLFSETVKKHPNATLDLTVMTPSGNVRTVMPHVFSNTRKLQEGDVVIHSRQVGFNGYRAELERTFIVGEASDIQRKAFEAARKAQEAALEVIKPGIAAKEVDLVARKVLEREGFAKYAIHRVGHAIGVFSHEEPYLRFDSSLQLEEGMVFCIEPGIYIPEVGGFRHSDTVIITADGYRFITDFPRDLESLTKY
ncbi:X-Pro dipeptidase [Virgibacillus necropolis]|uniref:X-Pro dipeptidase n=1 Tax=Virgibacillus necropolis TaxID=163877 RepID=A0A221MIE1_9BACI|nr:X-Pro dipeptidase [Virgibacillus necropolis]